MLIEITGDFGSAEPSPDHHYFAMSKKRTSPESVADEQTNEEGSAAVFEQGDDVKRAKLALMSDTTLQDLPVELVECILVRAIAMEVLEMHLAKSVWKDKAELVISRLSSVCPDWSNILTTNFVQNQLYRTLDRTVEKTIRLEILHSSVLDVNIPEVVTLKDELFVLCQPKGVDVIHDVIHVYDRNNMAVIKDVIDLSGFKPEVMAACNVSDCLYILSNKEEDLKEVLRISKEDEHQFSISSLVTARGGWSRLYLAANGSIMLWNVFAKSNDSIKIILVYDENGSLQHEMVLPPDIVGIMKLIPKFNGNLVVVSSTWEPNFRTKLVDIDMNATILRQYQTSLCASERVCPAGSHGQIILMKRLNIFELLDNEFNLLNVIVPQLSVAQLAIGSLPVCFYYSFDYNNETNEIVTAWKGVDDVLCIFHFIEE